MEQSNMDIQSFQAVSEEFVNKYKRMEEELCKANNELKIVKKKRKELLQLVYEIARPEQGHNVYEDHKDKLFIATTNLYPNLADIVKDSQDTITKAMKIMKIEKRSPHLVRHEILKAQDTINLRNHVRINDDDESFRDHPDDIIHRSKINITPTRHTVIRHGRGKWISYQEAFDLYPDEEDSFFGYKRYNCAI